MTNSPDPERYTREARIFAEDLKSLRMLPSEMSVRGGCQCKVEGGRLVGMVGRALKCAYPDNTPPNPAAHPEDCAHVIWRGGSLLLTTDLNPPVGPRPFDAGRISALHAMSDVFARGGGPVWALATLVSNPDLPSSYADAALAGVMTACAEAGVAVVGGQTIVGPEMMIGLTVVGVPRRGRLLGKAGAEPGEILYLSKPLGVGLAVRGYQLGIVGEDGLEEALEVAGTSNEAASVAALDAGASASTDVTGFGLLGHLSEMLGKGLGARIAFGSVPLLQSVAALPPGMADTPFIRANLEYAAGRVPISGESPPPAVLLDPQTNGGLLVCAGEGSAPVLAGAGFIAIGVINRSGAIEVKS